MIASERGCPVCAANIDESDLFLSENIDPNRLSALSYSSRKYPEFMCHRLVRCRRCDVVYAPWPPPEMQLEEAYHAADYDTAAEAADAAAAYAAVIDEILPRLPQRTSALEIGTGTGAFLEALLSRGFRQVCGVEPSAAAVNAASPPIRKLIIKGAFRESLFSPESFDLICCFMTMEHVSEPKHIAESVLRLLRPGGAFATVTHDYSGLLNRMLGRRSPIIDVEHLQLFSQESIRRLFALSGYSGIRSRSFANSYALRYWIRLLPLPYRIPSSAIKVAEFLRIDKIHFSFNVGNTLTFGFK